LLLEYGALRRWQSLCHVAQEAKLREGLVVSCLLCCELRIKHVLRLLLTHATKLKQLLYVSRPLLLRLLSKSRLLPTKAT
jgi:hypothetical protein